MLLLTLGCTKYIRVLRISKRSGVVEMEMRAKEDIEIGQDITPTLTPLSFSLHDSFLLSHCSSCFSPLPSSPNLHFPPFLPSFSINPNHVPTLLYCSQHCSLSDSPLHVSSAEFHLLQSLPSTSPLSSDLRAALRLLHSLPAATCHSTQRHRVAGLLTNHEKFTSSENSYNNDDDDEEEELLIRIREGAKLMAAARRKMRDGVELLNENDAVLEEAVLCLVLTNAVEVHDKSGRTLGIAVYDARFSWINHSCSPNACYRFLVSSPETPSFSCPSTLQIVPSCTQV